MLDFEKNLYTAAFSGYRANKFPFSLDVPSPHLDALVEDIFIAIENAVLDGYFDFYCGAAWGFDILAGEAVLAMRKRKTDLHLICAIPYEKQSLSFPQVWKTRYDHLLQNADQVHILNKKYSRQCYHERNRYMIEHASRLICYYDGQPGGTAYTVKYAMQRGLEIVNLYKSEKYEKIHEIG